MATAHIDAVCARGCTCSRGLRGDGLGRSDADVGADSGGNITVGIDQRPTSCNPNAAGTTSWGSDLVLEAVLPSAFVVNDKGQSSGNEDLVVQAELTSTNPQIVVYTLDARARWSDGVPITAADFKYAWLEQRGTDASGLPVSQAASSLGYSEIRSVTGSNRGKTVTVVFRQPFADWQMLFHDLLPSHVLQTTGWSPGCNTLDPAIDLSGGPFVIASVTPSQIVLKDNPRWWGARPGLSRIVIRIANSPEELAAWARRGLVQVVQPSSFTPTVLQSLAGEPTMQSHIDVSSSFLQLLFSTTSPATAPVAIRQAVAAAVDRQSLVDSLVQWADSDIVAAQSHLYVQTQTPYPGGPDANAPNQFVVTHRPGTTPSTLSGTAPLTSFPTTADPASTVRLLFRAGYVPRPDGIWADAAGRALVLRLVVDGGDAWATSTAPVIVRQLQHAGFSVVTSTAPTVSATGTALANGAADVALMPFTAGPYPSQALAQYTPLLGSGGSMDWSGLDDPQLDNLLTQASHLLNPVSAQPLYAQADQLLWNEMVALPLFAEPSVVAWSVRTFGFTPNVHGPSLLWSVDLWQSEVPRPVGG